MTSPGPLTTVCGIIVLRVDGGALLQHRDNIPTISDPGLWVIPGGHLEPGEQPVDGAVREVEEETCYRCVHPRPLADLHASELGYAGDFRMIFFGMNTTASRQSSVGKARRPVSSSARRPRSCLPATTSPASGISPRPAREACQR